MARYESKGTWFEHNPPQRVAITFYTRAPDFDDLARIHMHYGRTVVPEGDAMRTLREYHSRIGTLLYWYTMTKGR